MTHAEIIAEQLTNIESLGDELPAVIAAGALRKLLRHLDEAHGREINVLKQRCAELDAEVAAKDEVIKRLNDTISEWQRPQMATAEKNAAKLPDGWKMYDKYQIRHTDGTPLKGKRYFVLRLDSDDPLEAARVAAAMSAYKGETPQGDAAKLREALTTIRKRLVAAYESEACFMRYSPNKPLVDLIDAALAAPPRNCDKYSHDEALNIWAAENENERNGCFDEWLYHEATEQEGGAK